MPCEGFIVLDCRAVARGAAAFGQFRIVRTPRHPKRRRRVPSEGDNNHQAKEGKNTRRTMDEATKAGYGVLLMRQALPKSEFYARTTANIRAGLQEPAPGPAGHDTVWGAGKRADAEAAGPREGRPRRGAGKRDWTRSTARRRKPQRGACLGATVSMKPRSHCMPDSRSY